MSDALWEFKRNDGTTPVAKDVMVDYRLACSPEILSAPAGKIRWSYKNNPSDVASWRLSAKVYKMPQVDTENNDVPNKAGPSLKTSHCGDGAVHVGVDMAEDRAEQAVIIDYPDMHDVDEAGDYLWALAHGDDARWIGASVRSSQAVYTFGHLGWEFKKLVVGMLEIPPRLGGSEEAACPEAPDAGAHYRYEYNGIKLDPFRICSIYGITDFGQSTLVKKSLRLGEAHKDKEQDLKDIICAAERMLEMLYEDDYDVIGGVYERAGVEGGAPAFLRRQGD